jgi:hypothetical protein
MAIEINGFRRTHIIIQIQLITVYKYCTVSYITSFRLEQAIVGYLMMCKCTDPCVTREGNCYVCGLCFNHIWKYSSFCCELLVANCMLVAMFHEKWVSGLDSNSLVRNRERIGKYVYWLIFVILWRARCRSTVNSGNACLQPLLSNATMEETVVFFGIL